ncbi:MAG: CopG family ribbon-helix-helix protein [Bacillota bacterium]
MTDLKKPVVSFTNDMVQELKGIARERDQECSDFINEILSPHLIRNRDENFSQKLKSGYLKMGDLNLKLSRKYFKSENKSFFNYEDRLAECD